MRCISQDFIFRHLFFRGFVLFTKTISIKILLWFVYKKNKTKQKTKTKNKNKNKNKKKKQKQKIKNKQTNKQTIKQTNKQTNKNYQLLYCIFNVSSVLIAPSKVI